MKKQICDVTHTCPHKKLFQSKIERRDICHAPKLIETSDSISLSISRLVMAREHIIVELILITLGSKIDLILHSREVISQDKSDKSVAAAQWGLFEFGMLSSNLSRVRR